MTHHAKVYLLGAASLFIGLLICAIILAYVWMSVRRRSAAGLFWKFDRDRQPLLFWLQILLVSAILLYQLFEIGYLVVTLVQVS